MVQRSGDLREVAGLFFRLGCIAFGGPAAHIAMLEREVVGKRQWVSAEHFLDLVGATNLIPGPNSTEMVMHCGYERAGWRGLVVAGLSFILPAVVITGVVAWLYGRYGELPAVAPFVAGIQPAVVAIIAVALWNLGQKALKSRMLAVLGALTAMACVAGANEVWALFACGLAGYLWHWGSRLRHQANGMLLPLLFFQASLPPASLSEWKIGLIFLKIGTLLYGSGYVLFAFMEAELVAPGLLTRAQLMDAIAVGQFTPGPVLSTATFVGWQLGGAWGAVLATVGIFLPSFLFVALLNPLIPRLRRSPGLAAFMDAINVGAVAAIFSVLVTMSVESLSDWRTVLISALSFGVLFYFRQVNSAFIVLGGALQGYLLSLV